jgi:DNA-binding LacI/PurR family transcriptional regulator
MSVTLKDIAERAGVTAATVSMVINNKPNISELTREKVLKIARELNYYPNAIARGLATRKSNAIGVIVPNLASSFVVRILQGIKSTNHDSEYTVQLFDTIGQRETETQLFQRLSHEHRIDGAILISASVTDEDLRTFKDESVPCVVVARMCDFLDSVYVNNAEGSYDATNYFIDKGHRSIACISCRNQNIPIDERVNGYKKALLARGMKYDANLVFEVANDTMAEGLLISDKLFKSPLHPTAVFVPAGDMVAIGIIKEAKKRGMKIPADLAIIGFDDIPAAEVVEPMLSTVRQPKLEMGDFAINMIIDKVEGREVGLKHKELATKLIIRESA